MASLAVSLMATCLAMLGFESTKPCSASLWPKLSRTSPIALGCLPMAAWLGDTPASVMSPLYATMHSCNAVFISDSPITEWLFTQTVEESLQNSASSFTNAIGPWSLDRDVVQQNGMLITHLLETPGNKLPPLVRH